MSSQAEHVGARRLGRRSKGGGKLRASRLNGCSAYTSGDPIIAGSLSLPHTKPPWHEQVSPARVP